MSDNPGLTGRWRTYLRDCGEVAATVKPLSVSGRLTKVTGLGSYTIPRVDVLVGVTFRSDQGAPLRATWNAPVAQVTAALGRPAVGVGNTIAIDLIAPGEKWGDRVNEIDFRFAKILRFGRARTHVGIDIFNVLNNRKQIGWDTTVTADPNSPKDANGLPTGYIEGARFGQPTNDNQFPQPYPGQNGGRAVRLAVGVRF